MLAIKKLILLLGLLVNTSLAAQIKPVSAFHNGLYLGTTIGVSNFQAQASNVLLPEFHTLGSTGIIGGGVFGYNYGITDRIKLGLEVFFNFTNLNTSALHFRTTSLVYRVTSKYEAGFRVLPGFAFSPTQVGHLVFGYVNSGFNFSDNGSYGFINDHFNRNGFQSGLGWVAAITQQFFIRLDGLYTTYGSQSSTGLNITSSPALQNYNNKLNALTAELIFVYKFR